MKQTIIILLLCVLIASCQSYKEYTPYGHQQTQEHYQGWVSDRRRDFLRMEVYRQFQAEQPIPHRSDEELYQSYYDYQLTNHQRSQESLQKNSSQQKDTELERFSKFISHRTPFQNDLYKNQEDQKYVHTRDIDTFIQQHNRNQQFQKKLSQGSQTDTYFHSRDVDIFIEKHNRNQQFLKNYQK